MPDKTLGIILGGGRGERLLPLTRERSKPAVPFGGKYRLVDVPISNCINGGIRRIFVLTQFNSASLHNHISRTYRFDSFGRSFIDILAAEQTPDRKDWYQGTADAVRQNMKHILNRPAVERVLILGGDQLYRMSFGELLAQHKRLGSDVTVAVTPVPRGETHRYGILRMDPETNEVTTFVEKPPEDELEGLASGDDYLASMGIYVFNRKALEDALADSATNDFGHGILPSLLGKKRMSGYIFRGYFEDLGTIRTFYDANLALTDPLPQFNFYEPMAPIYTHPRFLPGSKINDCHIKGSLVTEGVILNECRVERSVVGIRARIERGAQLKGVVVMGADFYQLKGQIDEDVARGVPPMGIGADSFIEHAIVDKNARIGRGVRITSKFNEPDSFSDTHVVRDGVVVIPKDVIVPDGTQI